MKKHVIGLAFLLIASITNYAQDTIPHVEGSISISIKKGTIECDLTLSNMPRLSEYYLRLNSGMNIRYIKNAEPFMLQLKYETALHDTLSSGESTAYFIPQFGNSGKKYLPNTIHMNYVGMYPVFSDTSCVKDWRGNIAFNGTTLRADGLQSAWCPILYDIKTDTRYDQVTYDLDITCPDCKVIYMNGSEPVSGTHAKVRSNNPQDLTLFAGNYEYATANGSYFLNLDATDEQLAMLGETLQSYQDYLEEKTGIPYKGKPVYIKTTPVSRGDSWLFASYPTIVRIGWDNASDGARFLESMPHELAHYYFGTIRFFNSEIGDMIREGFSEYIALTISRKWEGDSIYQEKLHSKLRSMEGFRPIPAAKVRSINDYKNRELYSYYYAPLILLAIEKEIGEEKMWEWIKALLQSPTVRTNYVFFEQTLKNVVHNEAQFERLRDAYFYSDSTLQNAVATLTLTVEESSASNDEIDFAETYYYFFFTYPPYDTGSKQNHIIKHTEILQTTCTRKEFTKITRPIFKQIEDECENDAGCTSDLNIFYSMEEAQSGLEWWLNKYNKTGTLNVKVFTPKEY